jgi:Fe-S-cluster containining protein
MSRFNLPVMQCDDGCGECCGTVLCKPHEYEAVRAYAAEHKIKPIAQGITCPWYQGGKCAVYPVRPWICRVFGHFAELVCPRGYNTNVPPLVQKRMNKEYSPSKDAKFLHEILPDGIAYIGNELDKAFEGKHA